MTLAMDEIMTRAGTNFALDRRRRDALATYAEIAAKAAGKPVQTWVRETWGFEVYEAKHLIRGNASEVMWERILKMRGPHCGWQIALPILGAIIGEDIAAHLINERKEVARERARYEAEEARLAAMEARLSEGRTFAGFGPGQASVRAGSAASQARLGSAKLGGRSPPD